MILPVPDPERTRHIRIESRQLRVGKHRLHALVSRGPATPDRACVVLVHGLGMSSRYLRPLARRLARHFEVHAPDLPGFGRSDKPERILTVPELADALAQYMTAAGLARASFVGNSLGCEILVELALRHPDRVERLVLQGPTADPSDRSAFQKVLRLPITGIFERWSLGWVALVDYLRAGIRRNVVTFRNMIEHRIEPKLPMVKAPALIVWGTRDYIVPRRSVARFARLMPEGRLVVIPGAAHGMTYSHPDALCDAILPFLLSREIGSGQPGDGLPRGMARPGSESHSARDAACMEDP